MSKHICEYATYKQEFAKHCEVYFAKRYETDKGPSDWSERIYMCACKVVLIVNERNDDDKSKWEC